MAPGPLTDAWFLIQLRQVLVLALSHHSQKVEALCLIMQLNPISIFYFYFCRQSSESWLRGRGSYIVKILLGPEPSLYHRMLLAVNPTS